MRALGLDVARFNECMESSAHATEIRLDMVQARRAGASGTPSFVLAKADPENPSKVTGIAFLRGAQPFAGFQAQIDAALADLAKAEE